jgi:predicted dehydrogenase
MRVKIGVLGVGHLGKIHVEQILALPEMFELIGFYDPNEENSKAAVTQFSIKRFDSLMDLINACDAIDVVTPTLSHFESAEKIIKAGKHIFIEKPLTQSSKESELLSAMVAEADIKAQVGHVERFNPAFLAAVPIINNPLFIEVHRLAQFNPRGTDVSVVFDLMIHDLDIVLSLVKSDIKRISASGVKVISDNPDIANVRLEFANGCVANITSSRISMKKMRKMRIFQKDAYISVDFLDKKTEVVKIKAGEEVTNILDIPVTLHNGDKKIISLEMPEIFTNNAIKEELSAFGQAIVNNSKTAVTIHEGHQAVKIAEEILQKINNMIEE